jgi:protein-S-isoprenylcysteine O-methyltransferase Ste14
MATARLVANAYAVVPLVAASAATGLAAIDPFRFDLGLVGYSGLALAVVGVGLVGWTVWTVEAGVTLSPVRTPDRLVVTGAFAHTRNPMYLGVLLVVAGVAVVGASPVTAGYAALLAAIYHLIVSFVEEPRLRETFGEEYDRYRERVPRWLPRWRD